MVATKELLMEPTLAAGQDDLRGCGSTCYEAQPRFISDWRIHQAWFPMVVQRRLVWRDGCAADELLSSPPFERAGRARGGRHRFTHCGSAITATPT